MQSGWVDTLKISIEGLHVDTQEDVNGGTFSPWWTTGSGTVGTSGSPARRMRIRAQRGRGA